MIRLALAGADTHLHATMCARCPVGDAGCCATPPGVAWSDAGRIVGRGGLAFLLAEVAAGRLRRSPRGLAMLRVEAPSGVGPRRCTYHGPEGCTIPPDRRAATCNYYLCDDALAEAGEGRGAPDARDARAALETLVTLYAGWDGELAGLVAARWPEGAPWDAAFLEWLGVEYTRLARATPPVLTGRPSPPARPGAP